MPEYPRITYQTSGRSFDRLFKEQSLDETKDVVRRKLGLGRDDPIELVQLRDGRRIDLEDDDDFEAFKALTKASLHATVAVSFPQNCRSSSNCAGRDASGEGERQSNGPLSEPSLLETALSDTAAPAIENLSVQSPGAPAPEIPHPPKRRKVAFHDDLAASAASHSPRQLASKNVGAPSPREMFLIALHGSNPDALAPPPSKSAKSRSSSEAQKMGSSTKDQTEKPKKHKRKVAEITIAADDPPADLTEEPVKAPHKKRKKIHGTPSRESSPTHGDSNPNDVDLSSDNPKKRPRKGQTSAPEIPAEENSIPTGIRTGNGKRQQTRLASPIARDVPLQAGMEVPKPDTPKQAKTEKRKLGSVDVRSGVTKSKTGAIDLALGGMPDLTKSVKKNAPKKLLESEVSKASNDDDINKTIAALLNRRQQADPGDLQELLAAGKRDVSVDDPTPKTNRKSVVKRSAKLDSTTHGDAQVPSASSVEAKETNGAERGTIRKANQRASKSNKPLTLYNPVGLNAPAGAVIVESANSQDAVLERDGSSVGPSGPKPGSKLGTTQKGSCPACSGIHLLADCPIAQKRPDSTAVPIAQMEKDPGLVPLPRRRLVEKLRSTRSDSGLDSSDTESESFPVSMLATTPMALSEEISIAESKSTIPKGLEISEVPVEAHGEGSSSDSSTEGESETSAFARVLASLDDQSGPVDLDDQLTALINGPAKSRPRKSILDEIPSSSEAESESSSEDLILEEEEDLSKQPSHKRTGAHSKIGPSSIEPEHTSEDEEDESMPVYMDTSHEMPDHPQKLPAVGGGSGDRVSLDAEASERPKADTYLAQPLEVQNQDHATSLYTVSSRVDATTPPSRSSTKPPRPALPESNATGIDTGSPKFPTLASAEPETSRVLVSASSPVIDRATTKANEKVQSRDATDDVESPFEPHGGYQESDPIEQESTQPVEDRSAPSQSIDSVPRNPQRRAPRPASNPPVSEQPSRRSDRLANRRSSVATSEATLVPLTQIRDKMTSALKNSMPSTKEDKEWIRDVAEVATRGKRVQKPVGNSRNKSVRSTARHSGDSGDDTSPSVAREDGSPRAPMSSQVKWTALPPSDQTQPDTSSVVDELQTSSQGPVETPPPCEDDSSRSDKKKKGPFPSRKGVMNPSRGGKNGVRPLFFPGSSQVPRVLSASPSGSENESEMAASLLSRKTPTRSTPGPSSQFRRLSDMASSDILFSKTKAAQQRFKNTPSLTMQPRFDASDDGDDDDESSSSSEDTVMNSHIPRERRAGAVRRRKSQGLSSLI